jgi:photosystem II stability/assembly factor-like uncharacterized protein
MLSSSAGVGVAREGTARDELVATTDGGTTWRATGALPARVRPTQSYELEIAFTSMQEGWVRSSQPAETLFTTNAGKTWSRLRTPGTPTSMSLAGRALWVISDFCSTRSEPPGLCPSRLLIYRAGQSAPLSERMIPTRGISPSTRIRIHTREATLLDRLGADSAIVDEGSEGTPSSLLLTTDRGRSWRVLRDPCEGLIPTGLVAPAAHHLILYCQLDGGMNQGAVRLFSSRSEGERWTLTAEGNIQGPSRGNISDEMATDLTLSANHHDLWLLGAVVGVKVSTNGGTRWTTALIETGGYEATLATAAPTDAWLPLGGLGLYRTTNGRTWRALS